MNLVSLALRRPDTIVVLVLASVLAGLLAIQRMPRDIFPDPRRAVDLRSGGDRNPGHFRAREDPAEPLARRLS